MTNAIDRAETHLNFCAYCGEFKKIYKYGGKSEPICQKCALGYDPDEPMIPWRKGEVQSRNAPCNCGSGKKYKKCCGK